MRFLLKQNAQARFSDIDFIKGLAIIWVVMFHVYKDFSEMFCGKNGANGLTFCNFIMNGAMGVDLFVIASGFLLMFSYHHKEVSHSPFKFIFARFKRLLPLYYAAIFLVVMLDSLIGRENFKLDVTAIVLHMLGLHSLTSHLFSLEGAWWFMGLIVQLYLLFPLLAWLLPRTNWLVMVLGCIILTVAARSLEFLNLGSNYSIFAFLLDFVAGMLIYEQTIHSRQNWMTSVSTVLCGAAPLLMAGVLATDTSVFYAFKGLLRPIISIGFFFLLRLAYRGLRNISGPLVSLISSFGLCSYAIYLFHRPLIYKYTTVLSLHVPPEFVIASFLALMLCIGLPLTVAENRLMSSLTDRNRQTERQTLPA